MSEINKETANRFLAPVPEQNKFFCKDGKVFSTLEEFDKGLDKMNHETFRFHANNEKNDFSNWVYDVIGDVVLADSLRKCKDKKNAQKKLKSRISYLKTHI